MKRLAEKLTLQFEVKCAVLAMSLGAAVALAGHLAPVKANMSRAASEVSWQNSPINRPVAVVSRETMPETVQTPFLESLVLNQHPDRSFLPHWPNGILNADPEEIDLGFREWRDAVFSGGASVVLSIFFERAASYFL